MKIHTGLMLLLVPTLLFAQDYREASGQTVVFGLTAGAKAAWDKGHSAARPAGAVNRTSSGFSVNGVIDKKIVSLAIPSQEKQQPLAIAVYRLDGHLVRRAPLTRANTIAVRPPLSNGCYWLRLESSGKAIAHTRLWIMR